MKHSIAKATLTALSLAVAGCGSSPPSNEEVQQAIGDYVDSLLGGLEKPKSGGRSDADKKELAQIKVINCAKSDAGGYKCDFVGFPMARSARFVKSDKGWVYLPQ